MASASSLQSEEQLQCSICLKLFTDPVSTPCGHNYCKTCITGYWASSGPIQCPFCKKMYDKRPQLQVNTGFRDMVEYINNMKVRDEDDVQAKPGEVPCDICPGLKLKAQKTCLVCLASYCQTHLESHQRVTTLKKHQLINAVSNLEDRVCKKHDKMLEFFCGVDQKCVCFMCNKEDHALHEAVPLEHAFRERKAQVDCVVSRKKMIEVNKLRSIIETKYSIEQSKKESEKTIADIAQVFTAPLVSLQRSQAELVKVIQEKQKAAQKQAENQVTQLEQDVAESRKRRFEMEQLLQTEDHLHLLQNWPSLSHTEDLFHPDISDFSQQSYVGMVKNAVTQMEKTVSKWMERLIHEVRSSDGCEAAEMPKELWTPPQDKLMMTQQYDAMDVTLDAYTAHSSLEVSEDGKQLRFRDGLPSFTGLFGRRFTNQPFVLGKEGFSSGRFYYEVRVSRSNRWVLGVAKESVDREKIFCSPEIGLWSLEQRDRQTYFPDIGTKAPLQRPQTVGVFVDYEKGEVSFYDVDARTLLYSYTGCSFIETIPTFRAFLSFLSGTSLSSRAKLYPVFGIFEDCPDNMLEITPVCHAT